MNNTTKEAVEMIADLRQRIGGAEGVEVVIFPPFTALSVVEKALRGSRIGLGGQNMYWEEKGAYTGEVSASMLVEVGCKYVILGHSERRQRFGERDEGINKKIKCALSCGLTPLVCVGETLEERNEGKFKEVIENQVKLSLDGFGPDEAKRMIIAYEPVWAIGTGLTATPREAEEMHCFVRELLAEAFGENVAHSMRIQYGGSVKPENMKELMREPNIDGALVGGASLDAASFSKIVRYEE